MRELLSRIDSLPSIVLEGWNDRWDRLDLDSLEDEGLRHWVGKQRFVIWNDRFVAVCSGGQWIEVFPAAGGVPARYQDSIQALDHMLGKSSKSQASDPKKMPVSRLKTVIPDQPDVVKLVPTEKLVAILRAGSSAYYARWTIEKLAENDPELRARLLAAEPGIVR